MGKNWVIAVGLLSTIVVGCARKRVVVAPQIKAEAQVTRAAAPIEVIPASADLEPGASRLFFARLMAAEDHSIRFNSDLFTWRVQETDGGTVAPNKNSQLYFSYTAPQKPGYFHLLVSLKDKPTIQTVVSVKVGHPDGARPAEVATDKRRPSGAFLPE